MIREKQPQREIVIDLTGPQGNAFFLLGMARKLAKQLRIPHQPIEDKVLWRGGFGSDPAKVATIESIELTNGGKYGDQVDEVEWGKVRDRNVVVDLVEGNWAYGSQIRPYAG